MNSESSCAAFSRPVRLPRLGAVHPHPIPRRHDESGSRVHLRRRRRPLCRRRARRRPQRPLPDVLNPALGRAVRAWRSPTTAKCSRPSRRPTPRSRLAATPPIRRARVLHRFLQLMNEHRDALAAIITAEHGKVFSDAQGEVARGIDIIEFACGVPQLLKGDFTDQVSTGIDNWTMRQPLGVVAASRRSTSRAWCRAGCSRSRSRRATRSC